MNKCQERCGEHSSYGDYTDCRSCEYGIMLEEIEELMLAKQEGRLVILPCSVKELKKWSANTLENNTPAYCCGWHAGYEFLLAYITANLATQKKSAEEE